MRCDNICKYIQYIIENKVSDFHIIIIIIVIFLKRSLVFPILLFSSISLQRSLRTAFLYLLAWNSAFRWAYLSFSPLLFTFLLFRPIFKACSDRYFAFLHFFFLGMVLISVSYTMYNYEPPFIIHQALYQIQSLKSISHFHCIVIRDFIQVVPEWSSGFPHFL